MRILHCISACREHKDYVARLSLVVATLSLALVVAEARAEISETLSYTDYRVEAGHNQSLARALAHTSPIRHHGKIFHAYTTWRVSWQFHWNQEAEGTCRIVRVATSLDTTIRLPRLDGGSPSQRERFQRYLSALHEHELGHHRIGRQAALEIDQQLKSMPSLPDCTRLVAAANRLAQHIVTRYQDEERTYDLVTVHGRLQGARLDH